MTSPIERPATRRWGVMREVFNPRMLVAMLMGFACGLPLLLTGSVLQAWMTREGVNLAVIGLYALVGLPYTVKFLWAPVVDRFTLRWFGRRRGWLLAAQVALMLSVAALGLAEPAAHPWFVALVAVLVTFFSASQDIVVDAYRREDLTDEQLGLGSSLYIGGYRVGMLLAGGGGLILADHVSFQQVYLIMSATMLVGIATTLLAREPPVSASAPRTLREAVIDPFVEYFQRRDAVWILIFILLYKIGDTMASAMTTPFYLGLGFSMTDIGAVVKFFGTGAVIGGGMLGGLLMLRLGINRSLWVFGVLQAVSTTGFAWLALVGHNIVGLAAVIAFENLSGGMGTAAYIAYMAALTNKKFTATQYALLTSLMGVPRVLAAAPTGLLAEWMGWVGYFVFCALAALPGLVLLHRLAPWRTSEPAPDLGV